jgi:hypothetical protein
MAVLTDEEANRILSGMVEIFGEGLPNPEHYPLAFEYYVKLYRKFYMEDKNENSPSV